MLRSDDVRFQAFGGEHLVLLAVFVAGFVAAIAWGRRHRGDRTEQPARRAVAVVLALVAFAMQAYQFTPEDWALSTSLPFQLCDLATVAAVVALWTRSWRATAFVYYVGLTLTVQAIVTPSLAEGFPHPRYFGFWALHFLVVWAAAYLTWGLGIRPSWRGLRFAVGATLLWAVAAFTFNTVAGTNYGYLNRKPPAASLLDYLGPWPWYVAAEVAIVVAVWSLLLTWPFARREAPVDGDRPRVSG